jgi:hypothetical protein
MGYIIGIQPMTHELYKHVNLNISIQLSYPIRIVAYHIDQQPIPFIRFVLEQRSPTQLTFPEVQGPTADLRQLCIQHFPEFKEVQYTGYVIYNKIIYAFANIRDAIPLKITRYWFCLVDEILNYQSVFTYYKVNLQCVDFLFSNPDYYLLKPSNGKGQFEIPYACFLGSDNVKQTELDQHFGPIKENYDHYLFESCDEALSHGGGVIRYAIFGTPPIDEKWTPPTMDKMVCLSWHSVDPNTHFIS